jgi:hypothetical protein
MIEQLMHLAGVNAAGRHRHHLVEARPVLVEEHAVFEFCRVEVLAADVVIAARGRGSPSSLPTTVPAWM